MDSEPSLKGCNSSPKDKYGERFLHSVFDEISTTDPDRLYASIPIAMDVAQGFTDLTFKDIAHCVDTLACSLDKEIGCSSQEETLAYLGLPDLRNVIVFLAVVKCGYKLLFLSPRNQLSTNKSLLGQTHCHNLIHAKEMTPLFKALLEDVPNLKGIEIAELDELQQQEPQQFMHNSNRKDTMDTPILILHSSGSTGVPKPITMTHGTFATFDYCRNLMTVQGRRKNDFTLWDSDEVRRFYSAFPPSHLAGFLSMIIIPIFSETSCPVLGPPLRPPSGQLVKEIMERQRLKSLFVPPAVAEQILQEPSGLDFFRGLDFMYTAGGPLSQSAGDLISGVTTVCQLYGSTETSQIPMLVPLPEDWAYMEFHPSLKIEMRPTGGNEGIYELVHHMDATTEKVAALNHNLPGVAEYATRDLFVPHATKPGLWRFHGRVDDIMVLSSGEKFFPVPMETKLSGHPSLSGALVVGQGRFQAALLLEPKVAVSDANMFIEQLWSSIEESNSLVPGQGRITRSKVLVASSDKPFLRAPKGTIVRSLTQKAYEEEINALYANKIPDYSTTSLPILKSTFHAPNVEDWVRSIVLQAFPIMEKASNTDDMFVLGLDSLRTIDILGMLKAALKTHRNTSELDWLSIMTIYSSPTIKQLAAVITSFLNADGSGGRTVKGEPEQQRTELMAALVERYTQDLQRLNPVRGKSPRTSFNVALTGSTGSLGKQLVQELSSNSTIDKIFCLDRAPEAKQKHKHANLQLNEAKLDYFTVKLGEAELGLGKQDYAQLSSEVDVIIHNAWRVDFSQIVESYEADHIRGVRALIDWSFHSVKHPRLVFISSISSVGNLTGNSRSAPIKEALITDYDAPARMGYAESKFVGENMLGIAAKKTGIPVSILRVGQVAGSTIPEAAQWPMQEWFPSLVKTSKAFDLLPKELPLIDWVPIDKLAAAVVELMLHDFQTDALKVYNVVNPHAVPWSSLKGAVRDRCSSGTVEVSLKDWIRRLKSVPENKEEAQSKPALKMLGFFERMAGEQGPTRFEVSRGQAASATMASLEAVNEEWMNLWLDQWGF